MYQCRRVRPRLKVIIQQSSAYYCTAPFTVKENPKTQVQHDFDVSLCKIWCRRGPRDVGASSSRVHIWLFDKWDSEHCPRRSKGISIGTADKVKEKQARISGMLLRPKEHQAWNSQKVQTGARWPSLTHRCVLFDEQILFFFLMRLLRSWRDE